MSAIITIDRMHVAAKSLENIRDQLDALLASDPCGCGECEICHGLAMLANDAESLANTCRATANAPAERLDMLAAD